MAAALALLVAAPAAAETTIDVIGPFSDICLQPGRKADAIGAARRQGYVTPPKFMGDLLLSSLPAGESTMLWKVVDGGFLGAFFMDAPLTEGGDLIGETCGLFVAPSDPELERRIVSRLGVGAGVGEKGETYKTVMFEDVAGGRRRVDPDSPDLARLMEAERLHMVMYGGIDTQKSGEMTMIMHIRPRPK